MTSDQYFIQKVLPLIRKRIFAAVRPVGKLRGRGAINKKNKHVEFLLDGPAFRVIRIVMSGSYMWPNDWEYNIFIDSPYYPGTHSYHELLSRHPVKDANTMVETTVELLQDYIR